MPRDPRVDAYIESAPDFARPILVRIRAAWHKACPDVQETIKWGAPYFEYNGPLGGMAAFKAHVGLGFWKAGPLGNAAEILGEDSSTSMRRIRSLEELPAEKTLVAYMRKAVALNGEDAAPRTRKPVKVPPLPADFRDALQHSAAARTTFENFPPSQRREYIEWVTEAKQAATRERRIAQAVEWLAEGKPRNWKYMKQERLQPRTPRHSSRK